ncbi:MAG: hypothetical protein QOJ27_86 [Sphingomonadales bacterium]|nr:hypothetical protein [Sphingomonadales bacterium]
MSEIPANTSFGLVDLLTEPAWLDFDAVLGDCVRCHCYTAETVRVRDDEANYYRERAEVEAMRASEAIHPTARRAHFEMMALYRRRAHAALQPAHRD